MEFGVRIEIYVAFENRGVRVFVILEADFARSREVLPLTDQDELANSRVFERSVEVVGELVADVIDLDAIADFEIENLIASAAAQPVDATVWKTNRSSPSPPVNSLTSSLAMKISFALPPMMFSTEIKVVGVISGSAARQC